MEATEAIIPAHQPSTLVPRAGLPAYIRQPVGVEVRKERTALAQPSDLTARTATRRKAAQAVEVAVLLSPHQQQVKPEAMAEEVVAVVAAVAAA